MYSWDISLPIVAVLSSFGPHLKYIVSGIPNCCVALLSLIEVDVRGHDCHDVVEKLYYSAKFDPICTYRGKDKPYTDKNNYQFSACHSCKDKPAIKKQVDFEKMSRHRIQWLLACNLLSNFVCTFENVAEGYIHAKIANMGGAVQSL